MAAMMTPTHTPVRSQTLNKRPDAVSWDDYFMGVAFLSAMRSKDPTTQVGACLVNPDRKIVGIGYNGFPWGCSDDEFPWSRHDPDPLKTKYPYVCHAEMNAILNRNSGDIRGCSIYVAMFPCNECTKLVIQSRLSEVVYYGDKYHDDVSCIASRKMLDAAGITYRQHIPQQEEIVIRFDAVNSPPQPLADENLPSPPRPLIVSPGGAAFSANVHTEKKPSP